MSKVMYFLGLILLSGLAVGGMQNSDLGRNFALKRPPVTERSLQLVNQAFYASFTAGEWYFQGAKAENGHISVYIQIPEPLDMTRRAQENYLKQAICPNAKQQVLWHELKQTPLSVHIYTYSKRHTVYAECDNPLA